MLTEEMLYKLTEYKCKMHNVAFSYCYPKMLEIKPNSDFELFEEMDKLLAWAYFHEYYALYEGIISYRECWPDNADIDMLLDNPN